MTSRLDIGELLTHAPRMRNRFAVLASVVVTLACGRKTPEISQPPSTTESTKPLGSSAPKVRVAEDVAKEEGSEACTLDRWEDGDTAYVTCPSGAVPVRLLSIDTPESGFDDNSNRRARYQSELWHLDTDTIVACGKRATVRAKELCKEGSTVTIVGNKRDKYNRRLGFVLCAGMNVNERLVSEGHAGRYPYPGPPEKPTHCP